MINDDYDPYNETTREKYENIPILFRCLSFCLVLISVFDMIGLIFYFNLFILGDDIAILITSIIYICFIHKGKEVNNIALGIITFIVCFGGGASRIYGITRYEGYDIMFYLSRFALFAVRTVFLFICLLYACNCKK